MILFAVNDAGPAKYLSYVAKSLRADEFKCLSSNVSKKVFTNMGISCVESINDINMNDIDIIVTGTCLNSGIDKDLLSIGNKVGIKTIAIIEHWSLYKKRFELQDQYIYPDIIFVNDKQAKDEAINDGIPSDKLCIVGNPVLENIVKYSYSDSDELEWKDSLGINSKSKIITFVSESLKEDFPKDSGEYQGFNEFDVLNDILEICDDRHVLVVKLHPAEKLNKYDFLKKHNNIAIIGETDINKLIEFSDVIIGMGSMLLVEASILSTSVYSYRPNEKIEFIGNKNGIVKKIHNKEELQKCLLTHKRANNFVEKNNIFDGSTQNIINIIQENT